jgi:hypothetical protein
MVPQELVRKLYLPGISLVCCIPFNIFCWASSGRRGENVVGRDPICKGRGDFAVIFPADNKVVIVGEASLVGRLFQGDDWQTTWSCQRGGGGGGVEWLFIWPGIVRSQSEYSGRMWGHVLLTNITKESLEFVAIC